MFPIFGVSPDFYWDKDSHAPAKHENASGAQGAARTARIAYVPKYILAPPKLTCNKMWDQILIHPAGLAMRASIVRG